MQLEALVFDIDGTVAETEEAHREAFNLVFKENDLDWHWDRDTYSDLLLITGGKERIRHYVTNYNASNGQRYIDDYELIKAMHQRKTAIYKDLVSTGEVPLRPGVERLIRQARAEGMRLAIATTTNPDPLEALFQGTLGKDALNWFEAVAAGDMVQNKKPASDVYNLALEGLKLEGAQCLALEDTHNGVISATGANIPTLVTVSAYSEGQDFSKALAVVDNLGEPDAPFTQVSGPDAGQGFFDLELARRWHASTIS